MSDGRDYGLDWQKPVGWLGDHVPTTELRATPLYEVAKKLAWYMSLASNKYVDDDAQLGDLPRNEFHRHDGCRGPHQCEIDDCDMYLFGVFGFRGWKFPAGIVHYIIDHDWQPPQAFLDELAELPDPPAVVEVSSWLAPNKAGLFQGGDATR